MADLQDLVRDALARRFTVERELGRGGMGSVFLARDRKHNRSVAIKVLQPDIADAIGSDRFLREIEIAARLSHPHILPVFDSGRAAGLPYYVMPFVEGGTLRDRLRREGRLSVAETLAIASDLASALAFAHREGVVHRDVKPENILFSGELALLADFGVAKARDAALSTRRAPAVTPPALTDTGLSLGTPAYMSPEQCLALFDVDGRSDLYSLGCVIHEMLTGEAPFSAPTAAAILARRFSEEPPSVRVVRDDVPAEVEAAIRRALSRERAERFASVDEFAAALGGTAESNGEPTPVSAVSGRPRIGGRSLLIGSVALAAVVVAGGLAVRSHSPSRRPAGAIVVTRFENRTGDAALDPIGDIAADYLARGIASTGLVEVIDARAVPGSGLPRQGAVLSGRYFYAGDSLRFSADLSDAASGRLLAPVESATGSASAPTVAIERLRRGVLAGLAAAFDPHFADFAGASRPADYDAYREFLAGWQSAVFPCDSCLVVALAHYRRATALDPGFTLPVVASAPIHWFTGQCPAVDSIATGLSRRPEPLPPFDRALLDWSSDMCHGRRADALDALRRGMGAAPRSDFLSLFFARTAALDGRPAEALAVLAKIDSTRHRGDRLYLSTKLTALHLRSEHARELATVEWSRPLFPGDREVTIWAAEANLALGQMTQARQLLQESLDLPDKATSAHYQRLLGLIIFGKEMVVHGQPADSAHALFERAVAWARSHPGESGWSYGLPEALYFAGEYREARTIFERRLRAHEDDEYAREWAGAAAARLHDTTAARRTDRWFAARQAPGSGGGSAFARARIAAIQGDGAASAARFREALNEGYGFDWGLGPHSEPDFLILGADPRTRSLITPQD